MKRSLEKNLKEQIEGEVRFDAGSRALYATDGSHYRQVPIGVVIPKNKEDVIRTIALCHQFQVPLLTRGGGTSLAGQCCNVAVIMDLSKYFNRILYIDPDKAYARVEPGVICDQLVKEANNYQLTFGPDPSTHAFCTVGGMLGNNSCGMHSVMSGKTDDNVLELEIMTYDGLQLTVGPTTHDQLEAYIREGGRRGEIYAKLKGLTEKYGELIEKKYPPIPRRVSGYNLPWLLPKNGFDVAKALIGSESTCVTILEAKVRLIRVPSARILVVLGYPDIYSAADCIPEILSFNPLAVEGIDGALIDNMRKKNRHLEEIDLLPDGRGLLFVELESLAENFIKQLKPLSMRVFDDPETRKRIHSLRESGLGATAHVPNQKDTHGGWEDSAVAPDKLGDYLRDLKALSDKYAYNCLIYGHFGQGCLHTRFDFDFYTAEGVNKYHSFIQNAADLVVKYGGSLSGEHGDGQSRSELLPKMFGRELIEAFREFKSIWDPSWKMNPGKKIDAFSPIENLRLGSQKSLKTHFSFARDDAGSFAHATTRCVGVGKCRRQEEGTMCPSFMATKEEKHSTRGRAHLLFEMLQGEVIGKNGWKDTAVKEALDLCLSCKGCKTDCPMNVDMATYKAEFLAHYYQGRLRPRSAYAFGLIYWWAKLAIHMPKLANALSQSSFTKWLSGASQKRSIPRFAEKTFKENFIKKNTGEKKILLWTDTFTNHFYPTIAQDAVDVLEHLGFEVAIPKSSLCCGRPLYDYGMLSQAKKQLRCILSELKDEIEIGIPIVGLEPSCVSVFRDELVNLFPSDLDAKRLSSQVFLLSEFIQKFSKDFSFNHLHRKAVIHGHCHQKSVLSFHDEKELLQRLGLDFHILDSGCCGMAGSFGFENDHYDISMKIAEHKLLPSLRTTDSETLIITNGFSCKEQIEQAIGRKTHHLAEVLKMAIRT